jgi:hypothetical protein
MEFKTSTPGQPAVGVVLMSLDSSGAAQPAVQGYSSYNTAANTVGYQVKTGAGVFRGVTVNTAGVTAPSATIYDGTSTSGTKLATINTGTQISLEYNIAFTVGLFIVLSATTPADVTVAYQ